MHAQVAEESFAVLHKINSVVVDSTNQPLQDIRYLAYLFACILFAFIPPNTCMHSSFNTVVCDCARLSITHVFDWSESVTALFWMIPLRTLTTLLCLTNHLCPPWSSAAYV